jgi:hypothetical protein
MGIYHLPGGFGVGVVAETPWAAFAAKDVLRVSWTQSPKAGAFDSEASMDRTPRFLAARFPNRPPFGTRRARGPMRSGLRPKF